MKYADIQRMPSVEMVLQACCALVKQKLCTDRLINSFCLYSNTSSGLVGYPFILMILCSALFPSLLPCPSVTGCECFIEAFIMLLCIHYAEFSQFCQFYRFVFTYRLSFASIQTISASLALWNYAGHFSITAANIRYKKKGKKLHYTFSPRSPL